MCGKLRSITLVPKPRVGASSSIRTPRSRHFERQTGPIVPPIGAPSNFNLPVVGFKCTVFGGIGGQLVYGHSHGLGLARRKGYHWPLDGEIPSVLGPDRLQLRADNIAQIDRSGRVHHQMRAHLVDCVN